MITLAIASGLGSHHGRGFRIPNTGKVGELCIHGVT
jgi:hypothetical protein